MLIDAHCHLFSKEMIAEEFLRVSNNLNDINPEKLSKRLSNSELVNVLQFISHSMENNCYELYSIMRRAYGEDFVAIPLMIDLTYTNINPFLKTDSQSKEKLMDITKVINDGVLKAIKALPITKSKRMMNLFEKVQFKMDSSKRNIFKDNYSIQLQDMIELKEALPNRVFPFLSIDPRRDGEFKKGILGEIKKYVGHRKPFVGLKLYTSMGYSPTHPLLFDNSNRQSVYSWCQLHRIPITVHFSNTGFSHVLDRNIIDGDIYYPNSGRVISMSHINKDQILNYSHGMFNFSDMVKERQIFLNHPMLWKKVLEKYPKLRINFAHMGGNIQVAKYAAGLDTGYWTKQVVELLEEYKYAYTDLSFLTPTDNPVFNVDIFYKNIYSKMSKKVQRKILWGSDFFMLDLAETDLAGYLNGFKDVFGRDFKKISYENTKRFLRINV